MLTAARAGDQRALRELLLRAAAPAWRWSSNFCRNRDDAADIVQDVLHTLLRSLASFRCDALGGGGGGGAPHAASASNDSDLWTRPAMLTSASRPMQHPARRTASSGESWPRGWSRRSARSRPPSATCWSCATWRA